MKIKEIGQRGGHMSIVPLFTVADPGLPRREAPIQRGCQPIIWTNFSRKLHEIEKKLDREGVRS